MLAKLSQEEKLGLMFDLIHAFRIVKKPVETALFLQDLLTANEIRNLAVRLRIAKLLLAGKTFEEIQNTIHASSATITKVSVWLEQGGDGFKNVISRLPSRIKMPKKLPHGPIEYHLPQLLIALAQYGLAKNETESLANFVDKLNTKKSTDKDLQESFDRYFSTLKR